MLSPLLRGRLRSQDSGCGSVAAASSDGLHIWLWQWAIETEPGSPDWRITRGCTAYVPDLAENPPVLGRARRYRRRWRDAGVRASSASDCYPHRDPRSGRYLIPTFMLLCGALLWLNPI